jgi:hypothetical protein
MKVCKELVNVSEKQPDLYREVRTKKKGMERIGGGKRKRKEKGGRGKLSVSQGSPRKYWYRVRGTIKLARASIGTSQNPWWAD